MAERRAGRVQQLASDETPLASREVDVDARVGWLLAVSRLHHDDPAMADGGRFVARLAEAGVRASRSLVSRWESGAIPVSYETMTGYETALGLEPGCLSATVGHVRVATPGVRVRVVRPPLDPSAPEFADRLDELMDRAESGFARAGEWQDLCWHLAAAPLVYLRGESWSRLNRLLVTSLSRSVKIPYRRLSTAAMNLATVPRAQHFLTEAVADYLGDTQVWGNAVDLLGRLPTRRAASLLLDLVDDPPDEGVLRLAVWAAAHKLARGHFSVDERTKLDMVVLRRWRSNPTRAGIDLAELIASLPVGMRSTLTEAAAKSGNTEVARAVESGETVEPDVAASLSGDLARAARLRAPGSPSYDENRMLVRLVREALCHRDSERRHLAGLLLASSPFSQALADALIDLLASGEGDPEVRARAAVLVRYQAEDAHRLRMLRLLDDPDDQVTSMILQGLGYLTFTPTSDQVVRASLRAGHPPTERERTKMYVLGMTGSPALLAIAGSESAPQWQRDAARWWLAQGSAVRA
jgi:HEAT repeat protein